MIIIEGVSGAGKSVLANSLAKHGFPIVKEPVAENTILPLYYQDKARYAFLSQVYFLANRFKQLKQLKAHAILDRSWYGDAIFVEMLYQQKLLLPQEYETYQLLLATLKQQLQPVELLIYLDISPKSAIKRIQQRNYDYEQQVELSYWYDLHTHYSEFIKNYHDSPLLIIESEHYDFLNNYSDQEKIIKLIKEKLGE